MLQNFILRFGCQSLSLLIALLSVISDFKVLNCIYDFRNRLTVQTLLMILVQMLATIGHVQLITYGVFLVSKEIMQKKCLVCFLLV